MRTKHPLAIRYNDQSVLENHHIASAFSVALTKDQNNIFRNMKFNIYQETRQTINRCCLECSKARVKCESRNEEAERCVRCEILVHYYIIIK